MSLRLHRWRGSAPQHDGKKERGMVAQVQATMSMLHSAKSGGRRMVQAEEKVKAMVPGVAQGAVGGMAPA